MRLYAYLGPKMGNEPLAGPVYRINGRYYDVFTLDESPYAHWENEALFGIPVNVNYQWQSCPVLIETSCGGLVIEARDDGHISIGRPSTKRALDSPITNAYTIILPDLNSHPLIGKRLPRPDPKTWRLLRNLVEYGITINEYLGITPIREGGKKVTFNTLLDLYDSRQISQINKSPRFSTPEQYDEANVILIVTDIAGEKKASVGRGIDNNTRLSESIPMKVVTI